MVNMSQTCKKVFKASVFSSFKVLTNRKLKNAPQVRLYHLGASLAARISFNLADIGEGIKEVVVKEWFVKEGDTVKQFDDICEVQSDKASVTITSRYDGVIAKLHYKIDDVALVGKPLVDIEADQDDVPETPPKPQSKAEIQVKEEPSQPQPKQEAVEKISIHKEQGPVSSTTNEVVNSNKGVLCIPAVRRLAKEHNLDLTKIKGTGRDGRILKEDVLHYLESVEASSPPAPKLTSTTSPSRVQSMANDPDRVEPIKGFQKAMVKTMTDSLNIPHFVYADELKITRLSELRKTLKISHNQSISFMPFLIKAVSNALQSYPVLNSSIDDRCENVIYHGRHNIGVAMDTKVGLAVPVIKDVQSLGIMEINEELKRLIQSGKQGVFKPSDLAGGTFALSNIGSIGGTYMKPVILPPQVAIIAIGTSQLLPRYDENGNTVPEEIANISVAADHRVIDGATVANFVKILKKQVENPYLLFLNI
nr:unnamed protein product [Callosobruchus analis]